MKRVLLAVAGLLVVGAPVRAQTSAVDKVAWLAGCWEQQRGTRTTMEMWMPASGGAMLGASRTVVAGRMREFEFLRIMARADTLVYTAMPNGRAGTDFRAVSAGEDSVRFENRAHDFPQVIVYRRTAADSVVARIEGPGQNNAIQAIEFPMRRASCGT